MSNDEEVERKWLMYGLVLSLEDAVVDETRLLVLDVYPPSSELKLYARACPVSGPRLAAGPLLIRE